MTQKEVGKDKIRLDKSLNRIIITLDSGDEISIMPATLREYLPCLTEDEKVKELFMMIHEIEKEKLINEQYYVEEIKRLNKGLSDARSQLTSGAKMVEVKRLQVIIKSYVDEKNNLIELRRIVNLLEKQKAPLRTRLAELGHKLEEMEG